MFGKKKMSPSYDPTAQKPVLRCSICTGEQVAGFQDLHTGHFTEVQLIRSRRNCRPSAAGTASPPTAS